MTKFPLNDAANWVEAYGSPLYVYDAKTIRGQYFRMKHAFDQDIDVDIHYACKALNNPQHSKAHAQPWGRSRCR